MTDMRVDLYLYKFGYLRSRQKAQDAISSGSVTIDGKLIEKPAFDIDETRPHDVEVKETCPFVGRGGLKLEGALNTFRISPVGKVAADIGASTGGFTDCLLRHGAAKVYAIDAGFGQLDPTLRCDPRVVSIERFNARELKAETIGEPCDLAVMDVSFISQTYILPGIAEILRPHGQLVTLIKPQFEAGKSAIGKNGIVRSGAYRFLAVKRVLHSAETLGFACVGLMRSPIKGGDGNIEYLAAFERNGIPSPALTDRQIQILTAKEH
ncbi:MAG: TlyA family RNA methyltransferase [Clostridia bacterium]|nr:TlyA family RNA methyltransferase [Clostridia bacterium]